MIGLAVWVNQRWISSITSGGELIAEVEKDKGGTSGEQLLIRHMVSFRQKYTYRPRGIPIVLTFPEKEDTEKV